MKRYVPQIAKYVNSLCPELSDTWHADELFQKMKGGVTYKGKSGMAFLWNVMDRRKTEREWQSWSWRFFHE